ncbi:glycoside hydrolase family 78 protein, partial [Lysinibacillus alkalisoli]|uniref:glycoside hydrolase family 78 protein n=1 Tax=Lysinibacillus alkalisoli TaxID=1911548 RepID=UPI00402B49B5
IRARRGGNSARHWYWYDASTRNAYFGWRPVLEVLNSTPLISGGSQNLGNKTGPFSVVYQVSDPEGHSVNVTEKINGKIAATKNNVPQKQDLEMVVTLDQWAEIPLNQQSTITIEAIDEKGAKSERVYTFTKTNAPPVAKTVEPKGDLANIAIVSTITPTFVYQFIDTDPGDIQTAMQLIIENTNAQIVHDSGKRQTAQSFYQLPDNIKLEWGVRYKWRVRVWDKYDVPSDYTFDEFFLPNRPPNVANLRPGSNHEASPEGTSLTPTFKWDFEDLDLEAQAAYQLAVRMTDTDAEIYNTNKIYKNVNEHTIPDFVLTQGAAYYAQVTVWDPNGIEGVSDKAYIVTNATPTAPILTTPINNYRTTLKPALNGIVGTDKEDDGQHFIVQISKNADFTGEVLTHRSDENRAGWKVNGYDIPEEGVKNDQAGQTVSYTVQEQIDMNAKYYWRMAAIDASTKAIGKYGEVRHIRAGNKLAYDTLKQPIDTAAAPANRVLVALDYAIATDGSNPATIKVWICNNANDIIPTWEDMTTDFLNMDYYTFTNNVKTAETWAVALKVEVVANDTMGDIFIASHGFTFD